MALLLPDDGLDEVSLQLGGAAPHVRHRGVVHVLVALATARAAGTPAPVVKARISAASQGYAS